jgi:hypothetical protein
MDPEPRKKTIKVSSPEQFAKIMLAAARTNPEVRRDVMAQMLKDLTPVHPPMESLPCANANWKITESTCVKPGRMVCGSCRLTAYCSRVCLTNFVRISLIKVNVQTGMSESSLESPQERCAFFHGSAWQSLMTFCRLQEHAQGRGLAVATFLGGRRPCL